MDDKLFFHQLELIILNSYIPYGFREQLLMDVSVLSHEENTEVHGVKGSVQQFSALASHRKRMTSCVPNEKPNKRRVCYCEKCDCGLYVVPCFKLWHTKTQL
jgi:hypothetical protein